MKRWLVRLASKVLPCGTDPDGKQGLQGLPYTTIPMIFSFLKGKDIARCACVAKEWACWGQHEPFLSRVARARLRAEMSSDEKSLFDWGLREAANRGCLESLQALLDDGADINAPNNEGKTALMIASCCGYKSVVDKLIAAGAKLDSPCNRGKTALNYAQAKDHLEIVQALKDAGAKI